MLTPPKWQLVWLKSQRSLRNSSTKIMFLKPSDKIFDDLSKCCSSLSKELSLEALSCWKIWLEYQEVEDWKQNEICYSAIRPLITKKFHPLAKDNDVIVNKLNLMWFALERVQSFMHLEGPQHILEVFIQSCTNWLSSSEEIDADVIHLILKLLCSLFSRTDQISFKSLTFPSLNNTLLLPNKFFGRLLNSFLEIFHNWMKIKEKSELLFIWKHFLEYCEKSFKFIPVSVWHKIFRLVENICRDENESFYNKMSLLHMCATSLKSVMYSSKFIDSINLLTTPAEALLKIAADLCLNAREENYCFEIFNYCKEICKVLSKNITHTFGYDFCLYLLPKIEEIDCKTLFWGLWCGLAELFKEEIKKLNLDEYSKIEIKVFRKLRAIAVNFELDKFDLDYRSILMIQKQLGFFRIGSICEDCPACCSKLKMSMESQEKGRGDMGKKNVSGMIGCDAENSNGGETISEKGYFHLRIKSENSFKKVKNFAGLMKAEKTTFFQSPEDKGWIRNCLRFKKFDSLIYTCINLNRRLINNYADRRSILFAPTHLKRILDEIITKAHRGSDKSSQTFVENVKKLQGKTKEGRIFAPIRFLVSLKGRKGVEFCGVARRFWELLDEVVHDIDFEANLNAAMSKKENSIFCFCMFFLLVNFIKNLFVESLDEGVSEESGTGEEMTLSMKIVNFMKNVVYCEEKHSRDDFIDDISEILPRSNENPLVLLMKLNSVNKNNENGRKYIFKGFSNQESTLNDNLVIFKYFDEFENEVCGLEKNLKNCKGRKKRTRGKRNRQKSDSVFSYPGEQAQMSENNNAKVKVVPVHLYERWNCISLSALETTVNKTQQPVDFETSPDVLESKFYKDSTAAKDFEKGLEVVSSNNKTSEESDIENRSVRPRKRKLRSFKNRGKKRALSSEKNEDLTEDERREKREEENSSPRVIYSLRSRPLKFPNKFKDMDVKAFKEKGVKRKSSLKNCRTEEGIENAEWISLKMRRSLINTKESDEAENVITDRIDPEIVHVVHSMVIALEREEENEMKSAKFVVKLEVKTEEEEKDSENLSRQTGSPRGVKRRIQCEDEKKNVKQLKIEESAEIVKEEPMSCEDESRKCHVPMVQNRGSRMLALVPESARIECFHDSSPSSKCQTVTFPRVQRNSRASKMLALLPERQGSDSNGDVNCLDESSGERDENRACGIGGYNPGKIHHITPKKNILFETPKHSLRQRKSIRFDDDRNETVTYFTDSPPVSILRSPKFIKR